MILTQRNILGGPERDLAALAATVASRCVPAEPDAVRAALAGAFERAVAAAARR